MEYIENRTFDEITVGDSASLTRVLTNDDILLFAAVSGDVNPAHVDEEFARSDIFQKIIAHGMWGAALISTVLGTLLPGPGTVYVGQTLRFRRPVTVGDQITVTVRALEKKPEKRRVTFECECTNQSGDIVIAGTAEVIAPAEKVKRPKIVLPQVRVYNRYARYRELMRLAEGLPPVRTAAVYPADALSVVSALEAAKAGLIEPIFVGPEPRIRAIAKAEGHTIDEYHFVPVEDGKEASSIAVGMAHEGEVDVIMKGSLPTEDMMAAVTAANTGLRTERTLSHVFAFDVPGHPRPIYLTDTVLNARPSVQDKRGIAQNAIDLLHALGQKTPKVAILGAVERTQANIFSLMDAAALCRMADRGLINGATLDGPLPLDMALSQSDADKTNNDSPVAGAADVLIVQDVEVGQSVLHQLESLGAVRTAGLILGARIPIVVSGPGDTESSLTASCVLAMLLVHEQRHGKRNSETK
jgi:phosphate acetyltransferase